MGSFQSYNLGVDRVDRVIDAELLELPIYNPNNSASITPITRITHSFWQIQQASWKWKFISSFLRELVLK